MNAQGVLIQAILGGFNVKFFNFGYGLRLPALVALGAGMAGRQGQELRAILGRPCFARLGRRAQVARALAGKGRKGRPAPKGCDAPGPFRSVCRNFYYGEP